MLLQSHAQTIRVFPAIPADWAEVSFEGLRADGAFLVSARRGGGRVREVRVRAEKGGLLRLANPFAGSYRIDGKSMENGAPIIERKLKAGQTIILSADEP
jgi:alpha-L-fucosidase 2